MSGTMLTPASVRRDPANPPNTGGGATAPPLEVTFLTSFLPYPIDQGGIMATAGFIEALAKSASTSVLVLTSASYPPDQIRAAETYYNQFCRSFAVRQFASLSPRKSRKLKAWHYLSGYPRHGFWSKDAEDALIDHLQTTKCRLVWCNSPFESKYLPAAKRMGCRTVVTTHNVEADLIRQQGRMLSGTSRWNAWIRLLDVQRLEKKAAKWADVLTAISNSDLPHFRRLKSADRIFLLPFSYRNRDALAAAAAKPITQNAVCFVGTMNWPPNVTAAKFLVSEVMPVVWKNIPDTKCFLVGKNPAEDVAQLKSDNVVVTGSVPSIFDYYRSVPVVAVPMRDGSGIKIKLVEAMAEGCAVVTTSLGAAGLSVENGRHVIVADTADEFAAAIVELLNNPSKRAKLGTQAQAFVRKSFSTEQAEHQVRKILDCLRLV